MTDFKKDPIAIYRNEHSDGIYLLRCGHSGCAYLDYQATLALVSELLHPSIPAPTIRTLKPLAQLTTAPFNIPSILSEPIPPTVGLAGASAAAFANAAHQPADPKFANKPFGVGPAVLVSDNALEKLERCGKCFLGVFPKYQSRCGRPDCPYDEIPF